MLKGRKIVLEIVYDDEQDCHPETWDWYDLLGVPQVVAYDEGEIVLDPKLIEELSA